VDPKPDSIEADPPQAPTAMVLRIVAAERDYVDGQIGVLEERFRGLDRAASLLSETVNRTPTVVEKEIQHVTTVMAERFDSVQKQFEERDLRVDIRFGERDTRSEREARDNKLAVDAAFAAQEKQAVAQNEGNNLAIDKSEKATAETIKTNQDLSRSEINGLRKSGEDQKIRQTEVDEDIKKRLGAIEAALVGISSGTHSATETRVEQRAGISVNAALATVGLLALALVISLVGLFLKP
jgi:hypothetical protein